MKTVGNYPPLYSEMENAIGKLLEFMSKLSSAGKKSDEICGKRTRFYYKYFKRQPQ